MIIYGKNTVKEAIVAKRAIYKLFLDEKKTDQKLINFINSNKLSFELVSKHELNTMTDNQNHQGIVADVEPYRYKDLEFLFDGSKKKVLILDQIEDPHNLGAILRSVEATKIDAVILPKNRSVELTATVAKTAVGALEYVNVIQVGNINQTINKLKSNGFWVIGTDMHADKTYKQIDTSVSIAVIIGNEGEGISHLTKQSCDYLVNIPMKGKVNSLNASVAAALILYQIADL
ncbi:putative rRNA methylase [Acholeplasma morum]|uniref:23S rRNA (guanosine(2251)-2'-O)-methyltransferase RlmB n=1 Tax=Paracholeplasma morum TaxID=264637 RepID=UPI0019565838|nr:23S rRNA (guanosine(2251)-2'-O)-methyltransferase RlmB [Paracholeplasma morum]MBM7452892.1 putative rRNA methylase [Paracholeplasma morum]